MGSNLITKNMYNFNYNALPVLKEIERSSNGTEVYVTDADAIRVLNIVEEEFDLRGFDFTKMLVKRYRNDILVKVQRVVNGDKVTNGYGVGVSRSDYDSHEFFWHTKIATEIADLFVDAHASLWR